MKRHFYLSCSKDHCADPKSIIFQMHKGLKFMHSDKGCVK
eukprot:UN22047